MSRRSPRALSSIVGALLGAVVLALIGWGQFGGGEPPADPGSTTSARTDGTAGDADRTIAVADLPPTARETLELIDAGGPFPYPQDGSTFGNREGLLPEQPRGHYREYTVEKPGEDDRGPWRIVTGGDGPEVYYWTADHYRSFDRIER